MAIRSTSKFDGAAFTVTPRHTVYAVTTTGRIARYPFMSGPETAVRKWLAAHPDESVRIVPALPEAGAR